MTMEDSCASVRASPVSHSRLAGFAGTVNTSPSSSRASSQVMTVGPSGQPVISRRSPLQSSLQAKPIEEWSEEDVAVWISRISPVPPDLAQLLRMHATDQRDRPPDAPRRGPARPLPEVWPPAVAPHRRGRAADGAGEAAEAGPSGAAAGGARLGACCVGGAQGGRRRPRR
eukprot:CAMPEP_0175800382 /NCGR_PEP_ID=MMETSP0097-20121207/86982_1 /TAXON_ID=311494 /ORGANISM="Alexandrium monilatum, Strain CCMP3105" /LENGTH=170 /DNA_ID=CAMNT_0017111657 /DNA_START=68 /DNA_END=578 /DNA_ORIENTATION=+